MVSSTGIYAAGMVAAFLIGSLHDERQGRIGLVIVAGSGAIIALNDPGHPVTEILLVPRPTFALAWLGGFATRERTVQALRAEERAVHAEREREGAARIAVAEERARIARELHDIVAHAVSVMVLQVGAVRHRLPDGFGEDVEALRGVEETGRSALGEMRHLLGAMRRDGDGPDLAPQPGLDRLDVLLEEVRRAGLPVELHVDGEPFRLPVAIDLSAYRIVQEGLTNALKHARASHADVTVRYAPDEVQIEVRDDGDGAASTGDGLGHGLVGVRERVKIYGGEMSAGTANGGGFVLRTRLPLAGGPAMTHPRPRRRRPVDGPRRLPHAARRRAGHRGRRRGQQRPRGRRQGRALPADGRADGHPHARARRPRGHAADPRRRPAARVLILTTFDLDEYVYEALSAGASGFVLKDDPPEQLIAAVRTVAAGDALLSPAVTKRVIKQFTRITHSPPPKEFDELTAREREVFRLIAEGLSNAEIGERAVHQRDDRQDPRHAHPAEARPARPRPGRRARVPDRALPPPPPPWGGGDFWGGGGLEAPDADALTPPRS